MTGKVHNWVLAVVMGSLTSCGAITTTAVSSFKLRMLGTYEVPPGSVGTEAPRSHTYAFKNLLLVKNDGTEVVFYKEAPKVVKVIDRPQVVFANYDMSEYDGGVFSQARVELDTSVIVGTKTNQERTIVLDSGTLELNEIFTISKSKSQTLTIKVAWGQTVTEVEDGTDEVQSPIFEMVYADD